MILCVWTPLGTENAVVTKTFLHQEAVCPVEERDISQSTTKAREKSNDRRKDTVVVRLNCQHDTTQDHLGRVSGRNGQHGVGLWACLLGMILIKSGDMGRPLWVAPFPRQGILNWVRVKKWS